MQNYNEILSAQERRRTRLPHYIADATNLLQIKNLREMVEREYPHSPEKIKELHEKCRQREAELGRGTGCDTQRGESDPDTVARTPCGWESTDEL